MKIRRIPKTETRGLCNAGCHNTAYVEITYSAARAPLRLCERDARHLIEQLKTVLNNNKKSPGGG
jgi:hypothetical protein